MGLDFAIVAPILARTPEEAELLSLSVACLGRHGPVFLADGGSSEGFLSGLQGIPGVTAAPTPGTGPRLVAQVRQALNTASEQGARHVLYTEPDKRWFFENRLAEFLSTSDRSAVCLPSRNAASFATFPPGQQAPEHLFNTLAGETLGIEADFLYGPLLLPSELVPFLADIPPDLGWGWRTFLLTIAARQGLPIVPWEADLPCPVEQRGEDDERSRTYRIEQMAQNVRGLALGRKSSLNRND